MISIDTNLLFHACNADSPDHEAALQFVTENSSNRQCVISELVLVELYRLLRNPVVLTRPLPAPDAASVIQSFRHHPNWAITGFPPLSSKSIHDRLWAVAALPGFAYRRIYDARLALSLQHFGVTDFATANVKDFDGLGFNRVWNPLD